MMKTSIKRSIKLPFYLLLLPLIMLFTACPSIESNEHPAIDTTPQPPNPSVGQVLPLTDLPNSRYLSNQAEENPLTAGATSRGYDHKYAMLSYQSLDSASENPLDGDPGHIIGLPNGARYMRDPENSTLMNSKTLITNFSGYLNDPNTNFNAALIKILNQRAEAMKQKFLPRVVVGGLGPVGLLATLEAYSAGASVIGIEKRPQYTRPQVLRLTEDTINVLRSFMGDGFWLQLEEHGVLSRSPNWMPNFFDDTNSYLTPQALTLVQQNERDDYVNRGFEPKNVEIIRINHLETALAAVIESLAKRDPEHMRIYYGTTLVAKNNGDTFGLTMEISSGATSEVLPLAGEVLLVPQGQTSQAAQELNMTKADTSDTLYGATVALRLPVGFNIGLRPIQNREGTASVKGIAKIDAKFLKGSPDSQMSWSMISELQLCTDLNAVLGETYQNMVLAKPEPEHLYLPCGKPLDDYWKGRNGGEKEFLPRTRYFFTGGIAYLGIDLTEDQFDLFEFRKSNNASDNNKKFARDGLKKYLLVSVKKHMPKEYVEGQSQFLNSPILYGQELAPITLDYENYYHTKNAIRLVSIVEENSSLTTFPIVLYKGDNFYTRKQIVDAQGNRKDALVVTFGDTYASTHFFTGSGAVNGLRAAHRVGQALKDWQNDASWQQAATAAAIATDEMQNKVMLGTGNAPFDGPYNKKKL